MTENHVQPVQVPEEVKPNRLLKRPDYLVQDARGAIQEVYCKVTGSQIAARNGGTLEFRDNYAEVKMKLSDGSSHVSNMCKGAARRVLHDLKLAQAMYETDLPYSAPYKIADQLKVVAIEGVTMNSRGTV